MRSNRTKLLLMAALIVPLWGCDREESIVSYSAPKEPPPAAPVAQGIAMGGNPGQTVAQAQAADQPEWTVPAGWKQLPGGQMRFATFAVNEENPPLELAVAVWPPQDLIANINRWEGQVGLPPSPPDQMEKVLNHLDANGLHIEWVDLVGPKPADGKPQQQMLAALLDHNGRTWSFKMQGTPDKVAPQKDAFLGFLKSMKFKASVPSAGSAKQMASGDDHPHELQDWSLPPGWVVENSQRAFREKTFIVGQPGSDSAAEVIISKLPAERFELASNINRWRTQVGLPETADVAQHRPIEIKIAGHEGAMFDIGAEGPAGKRQLIALSRMGPEIWFVKILGPAKVVEEQRGTFESFLGTLKFKH